MKINYCKKNKTDSNNGLLVLFAVSFIFLGIIYVCACQTSDINKKYTKYRLPKCSFSNNQSSTHDISPSLEFYKNTINNYSTVTLLAKFRGQSTLQPRSTAMWKLSNCIGITVKIP